MRFSSLWSGQYERKCPDGTTKTVYRNADNAFSRFIHDWEGDVSMELRMLEQVPEQGQIIHNIHIKNLLADLKEQNWRLKARFQNAYELYTTDPCSNHESFKLRTEQLVDEQSRLHEVRMQLRTLLELARDYADLHEEILLRLQEITKHLGGKAIPEVASVEIAENRGNAKLWVGQEGNHGW